MLVDCVDLDALEQNARRVMRPESWVFCDTGADDEITYKDNAEAWRSIRRGGHKHRATEPSGPCIPRQCPRACGVGSDALTRDQHAQCHGPHEE